MIEKRREWFSISKKTKIKDKGEKMPLGAKIFDIAFTVFVYLVAAAILIGAILFAFSTSQDKALFGFRYYNVITPSMSPTYNQGDMIFVKLCDASEIDVGDVITYNPSDNSETYLTHRVVKKIENYENTGVTCFQTKGDANKDPDEFLLSEAKIIGKVTFGIPMLGSIVAFIKLRWYLIVPIIIMIAVFFLLLKRYFLLGKEDEDKEKAENETDESGSDSKPENTNSDDSTPKEALQQKVSLEKSEACEEGSEDTSSQGEDTEASITNGAEAVKPDPSADSTESEKTSEAEQSNA